jgi:hypothetical protein
MAISGKYGKISIPHIGEDEPVFVLRAQDRIAGDAIEMYRLLASSHNIKFTYSLQKEIDAFKDWKGNKKLPD